MGRFKIGAGLLAVLLALAVGTQLGMKAAQQPVAQSLAEAMEQVQREHFPEAEALVAQARQQWDRTRTFRAALADHQCLEDIDSRLGAGAGKGRFLRPLRRHPPAPEGRGRGPRPEPVHVFLRA